MASMLLRGIKARQVELVQANTATQADDTDGCAFDCNLHGTCNTEHEICVCDDGWYGSYCYTDNECEAGCAEPLVCDDTTNTCACPAGTYGDECQNRECASDCSGHGTCNNGTCVCHTSWSGDNCDIEMLCTGTPLCHEPNGTCTRVGMQYICTCNESFHGTDCHAYIPCIRNCSGNGLCDRGTCICDQGYTGVDCSKQSTCARNCSGHGTCVAGSCECDSGYSSYDCSRKLSTCPDACNYQGNCINSTCECFTGFSGVNCSIPEDSSLVCPFNCSGQGVCIQGQCDCNSGRTGRACDEVDIPCPNGCSGLGICKGDGVCVCNSGRTGNDCSKVVAGHGFDLCAHNCSGKGTCLLGACLCITGYSGTDCSVPVSLCEFGCSGLGRCEQGACVCDDGYSGSACATPKEETYRCPSNCSGHGRCIGSVCRCHAGYMGTDCHREIHCPRNCSGHGLCVGGQCICHPGFGGNNKCIEDSPVDCSQTVAVCVNNCSGNGRCLTDTGECDCNSGWVGVDCSASVSCPSNCSGHGLCVNGTCNCQLGYTNVDCSKALPGCDTPCAAGYICNASVCVSVEGYGGPGNLVKLPEGNCSSIDDVLECSGHGICDNTTNECVCHDGYWGTMCMATCPNNCSNTDCEVHGICLGGSCQCLNNYTGFDCSELAVGSATADTPTPTPTSTPTVDDAPTKTTVVSMASEIAESFPSLVQTHHTSDSPAAPSTTSPTAVAARPSIHVSKSVQEAKAKLMGQQQQQQPSTRPPIPHERRRTEKLVDAASLLPPRFSPPDCSSYNNCSGNGACIKVNHVGKCSCDVVKGFGGVNCDEPVERCPNMCSGGGWCNFTRGECVCEHLFFGADCSKGPLSTKPCPRNCSGSGVCRQGHCECNRATSGHDCSIKCPGGCSGNGVCVHGECMCALHFHGDDCATYQKPEEPSPGSHNLVGNVKAREVAAAAAQAAQQDPFAFAFEHAIQATSQNHGKPPLLTADVANLLQTDKR